MTMTQEAEVKKDIRIFLSYAAADRSYANRLRNLLTHRPNSHVFSSDILSAGENWVSRLRDEIARCNIFVVLLSLNSVESKWVLSELGAAWALNKLIIPVVTRADVIPKIPLDLRDSPSVEMEYLESHPEILDEAVDRHRDKQLASYNPA